MSDITCIIPTFNDTVSLPKAVSSVMSQQGVSVTVLLVDDCSDPATRVFLQDFAAQDPRVNLFLLPQNRGQSTARNLGAMLATTPLICFLDQDDEYLPGWLQAASQIMATDASIGLLSGLARFANIPKRLGIDGSDLRLTGLSYVFITNILFRRSVFLASGGLPVEKFWRSKIAGEDGVFRMRLCHHWNGGQIQYPALLHSVKEGGATVHFLDRSCVTEGSVQIVNHDPAEIDGSYFAAMQHYWNNMDRLVEEQRRSMLGPTSDKKQAPVLQPRVGTDAGRSINHALPLYQDFLQVTPLCIKHESYFQVYEALFSKYQGKGITFVEVGVFNGGSLAMWRRYLGPAARIIGIDLNPEAQKWASDGFEIFIGDQSSELFWTDFYAQVGAIDVLLDDGGHMNHQQIITAEQAIPRIRDGGVLVVEDVHTSYMPGFNHPPAHSFVAYAKGLVEHINARCADTDMAFGRHSARVWNVAFFESMVALEIDSRRCFRSSGISNHGAATTSLDYRHAGAAPTDLPDLSGFFS